MQDILKEYGPALITVVAIIALLTLVKFLIGADESSVVGKAFTDLLNSFFNQTMGGQSGSGGSTGMMINTFIKPC